MFAYGPLYPKFFLFYDHPPIRSFPCSHLLNDHFHGLFILTYYLLRRTIFILRSFTYDHLPYDHLLYDHLLTFFCRTIFCDIRSLPYDHFPTIFFHTFFFLAIFCLVILPEAVRTGKQQLSGPATVG